MVLLKNVQNGEMVKLGGWMVRSLHPSIHPCAIVFLGLIKLFTALKVVTNYELRIEERETCLRAYAQADAARIGANQKIKN